MNFFEAQKEAKASTTRLIFAFIIGIAVFAAAVSWLILSIDSYLLNGTLIPKHFEQALFIRSFISVIFVVALASFFQYFLLRGGGKSVALSLGGTPISPLTQNKQEIMLLNVVEEMAIASGIAPPPVYILKDQGINAFAAGFTYEDAVIGITQGALDTLNRQELQGVIAHEFSHIFHGDMRLNMHLSGLIYGIVFIGGIGRFIFDALDSSSIRRSVSHSSDNKKGGNLLVALYLFALGLTVIGWLGTMISELIKAMISRQREYLADASAIQYTRYPEGIAGALKKIGASAYGSSVSSSAGGDFSHLFFSDGNSNFWDHWFSTHPKLEVRIRRIDPRWDGKFTSEKPSEKYYTQSEESTFNVPNQPEISSTASEMILFNTLSRLPDPQGHFDTSTFESIAIPQEVQSMTANPLTAQWIVYALLLGSQNNELQRQKEILGSAWEKTQNALKAIEPLPRSSHLHLLLLAIPNLKMMSLVQYQQFRKTVEKLIDADQNVSIWEWSLRSILLTPLDYEYGLSKIPKNLFQSTKEIAHSMNILFVFLVKTQFSNEERVESLLKTTAKQFDLEPFQYLEDLTIDQVDQAVRKIAQSDSTLKTKIIDVAETILKEDGKFHEDDAEILEALKTLFHLSKRSR